MRKDRTRLVEDNGVSAVLGAILMLALMMTLVPGAIMLRAAVSDEMDAQREAAERAAWCARHPTVGAPTCADPEPMPGYDCVEAELDVWVCSLAPSVPTPTAPTTNTTLPPPTLEPTLA